VNESTYDVLDERQIERELDTRETLVVQRAAIVDTHVEARADENSERYARYVVNSRCPMRTCDWCPDIFGADLAHK
jgi:hypothetical protein